MIKLHTAEQIEQLNLPGFREEATIGEITAPGTDWQTVMSLSIYRRNPDDPEGLDVLTAVRTSDTPTHGNVASTPTGRFPKVFEPALLADKEPYIIDAPPVLLDELSIHKNQVVATLAPNVEGLPGRDSPFTFISHETLARKLGLSDALQSKKDQETQLGTLSLSEILAGFSWAADDPETGEPLWEPIVMYAGAVLLEDHSQLPTSSVAYTNIGWTTITDFLDGHQARSSRMVVPSLEPTAEIDVCVRGFCLSSTRAVTINPALRPHLGIDNVEDEAAANMAA